MKIKEFTEYVLKDYPKEILESYLDAKKVRKNKKGSRELISKGTSYG